MSDDAIRLDKWLWYARFFKSRTQATEHCNTRGIRVNSNLVSKPHYLIRPGDVLTFSRGRDIRIVRIIAIGDRRGPAQEARLLYDDLAPQDAGPDSAQTSFALPAPLRRPAGSGRPTKLERRAIDRMRGRC
ncbi:MAG: RNA-binding S4 domain-containing protein [Rhodospirillales bacterium]|nr:RNA-binding S4 domain-containing protein [Rhodospirillales bacterium]